MFRVGACLPAKLLQAALDYLNIVQTTEVHVLFKISISHKTSLT